MQFIWLELLNDLWQFEKKNEKFSNFFKSVTLMKTTVILKFPSILSNMLGSIPSRYGSPVGEPTKRLEIESTNILDFLE